MSDESGYVDARVIKLEPRKEMSFADTARDIALAYWTIYFAFRTSGFNEEQAFELLHRYLDNTEES